MNLREIGCLLEPQPGCSPTYLAFEQSAVINTQKSDTVTPETQTVITPRSSYQNSPNPESGCSTSHCSPLVLRPIPQPTIPITPRKRKLQKSEILTSTPIKEDQKQKFEKNKVKAVNKRLDEKPKNTSKKTVNIVQIEKKNKKESRKLNNQRILENLRIFYDFSAAKCILKKTTIQLKIGFDVTLVTVGVTRSVLLLKTLQSIFVITVPNYILS